MSARRQLFAVLALLTGAAALSAAQDTPKPRRPPASRVESLTIVVDSLQWMGDSLSRRMFLLQDSIQPAFVQAFAARRVRLGVIVNTRPRETDSIGAFLDGVTPNGPAAKAGLRGGDIIVRFNGTPLGVGQPDRAEPGEMRPRVRHPGMQLVELVAQLGPNDTVPVEYRRGKDKKRTTVVTAAEPDNLAVITTPDGGYKIRVMPTGEEYFVGRMPDDRALELAIRRSEMARSMAPLAETRLPPMMAGPMMQHLELAPLNPRLGSYFGTSEGVLVVDVGDPAPLGLKAGDVVLSVDGRKPTDPGHLMRILRSYGPGESAKLEIMRQRKRMTLEGKIGN
ncbi:MAG TPA: PDZ domain-containing protein [Gemmatimonadales bacterium]|nr:PDZ domain-containing protein [Gemmatimonadales bacterium]